MTPEKRAVEQKKLRSKSRLKATFVDRLAPQLEALTEMLAETDDPDAVEAIADELVRLAETAKALGLEDVALAITAASTELGDTTGSPTIIVDGILAQTGIKRRFAPIAIVADGALINQLERKTASICEPVLLFSSMEELAAHAGRSGFQAEIVPAPYEENTVPGRTVVVYGPSHDLKIRAQAREKGAIGYLATPLRLVEALRLVRRHAVARKERPPRLVWLRADEEGMEPLTEAMRARGVTSFVATRDYLFEILEDVKPDLLVVSEEPSLQIPDILALLGASENTANLPSMVLAGHDSFQVMEEAGAYWVLDKSCSVEEVATAIESRLRLTVRMRGNRDLWTGLLNRADVLYGLDRELARARRSGQHVTAALIEVLGVAEMNALAGQLVGEAAFRSVTSFIRRALREFDLVGHLGGDCLLVVLPGCLSGQGASRLHRILERIAAFQTEISEMAGMRLVMGIADTATSFSHILLDADQRLRDARLQLGKG